MFAQSRTPQSRSNRSDAIALQVVGGGVLGLFGSIGMAWLGAAALGPRGGEDPGLMGAVVGGSVGIVLGSALGVSLVASHQGYRTGFPASLAGAAVGFLTIFPLSAVVRLDADNAPLWVAAFGLPVAGAVIATAVSDHMAQLRLGRFTPTVAPASGGVRVGLRTSF